MDNEIVESAKEVAKAASKALDISEKLGEFLTRVFGTLPEDVVGVIIGDWLHQVRIRNLDWYARRTEEILKERGIKTETEPISPSIALPLFRAAQDETRDELRELWARMIANAMDSSRSHTVRQSIISAVKSFDLLDAVVVQELFSTPGKGGLREINISKLAEKLEISDDELEVSLVNLADLNCILNPGKWDGYQQLRAFDRVTLTSFCRELLKACSL